MRRFKELTIEEANVERRPFIVLGCYPGSEDTPPSVTVEYLDIFEYEYVDMHRLHQYIAGGWCVVDASEGACVIRKALGGDA